MQFITSTITKLYVGLVFFLMAVSEAYGIPFLYGLFWK